MADYDAIIIGSGNNGLMCALYLARAGWRVLVLEQASDVGGAARTSEVTLPGFKHDLFATNFTSFTGSPAYQDVRAALEDLNVRFLSNNYPYASAYASGAAARVYRDPNMTDAEMVRYSKSDLAGWRAVVALFKDTAPTFLRLYSSPMPSLETFQHLGRIVAKRPSAALALSRVLLETSRQFADRAFVSDEVKGLFTPWAFHLDYGPDVRGGGMFSFVAAISAHVRGLNVVEGGAGQLMSALRTLIENHGGQVMTDTTVTAIEVRNGRAVGVKVEPGGAIAAAKAVIANVTPRRLFGDLVSSEHLPSPFIRSMSRFRYAVGTFVLHLALDKRLEWKAAEDLSEFSYVHLHGRAEEIDQTYKQALDGFLPSRPMLIVSQTTQLDRSRAPRGKHVARIHARAFPANILGDASGLIKGRDWDSVKEPLADRLIGMLAEHAPNVRSILLARHAVSPLDLERANPNLIDGDCNGGSHHLRQYYIARPAFGWTRYKTPIGNLFMIGASQWPGSGVNAASGYLLARSLLTSASLP